MLYKGHRFPCEIISHTVWLYHRFTLSLRDVEDLMAERGVIVSYETIRCWCLKFGPQYAKSIRRKQGRLGDIWHVDELFVRIQGRRVYLWRAVDQDGDVLDILVTRRRDKRAAKRFFRKVLKEQGQPPWQLITDKLKTYPAAHREVFPSVEHKTGQYENNRVHPVNGEVPPVKGRPWKLPHYANRGKTSSSRGELASARSCFSTVRTALGKLRITGLLARFDVARSFPQFPRPLLLQPTIWTSERGADLGSGRCQPRPHLPIYRMTQQGSSGKWGGAASQRQAMETAALCKPWKNK